MSIGADRQTDPSTRPGQTSTSASLPDRWWVPAAAALVLALLFSASLLARAGGDVSLLVNAAPPDTSAAAAPPSLTVQPPGQGFDGQFFYRLGVSPWNTADEVAGVTFDLPSLRNARWGYGALAWLASGGDTDLVPWALLGLNVVAMTAVGALGGGLARSSGRHAAWGLSFALWPGFAYSLSMDTSELVASAFALGGLLAVRRRRWSPAAVLLAAAVLTRDTTVVVPAGMVLAGSWLWLRERASAPGATGDRPMATERLALAATGAVPLLGFGLWQLLQQVRFGELPLSSSGDNNLNVPLSGLVDQLSRAILPSGSDELFRLSCIVGLVGLLAVAAWTARTEPSAAEPWERAAWCLAVTVVVVLNAYLWSGATAFMRASTEAGLLSTLVIVGGRGRNADRLLLVAGAGLGGLWLLTAVAQLSKVG